MRHALTVAALIVAVGVSPTARAQQDPLGYERVLLPIIVRDVPGAFGSIWRSELVVLNYSGVPVDVFQNHCGYFCLPGCIIAMCFPRIQIPPGTGRRETPTLYANPGAFLYVNRSHARDVAFQLRVRDISRQQHSLGTEVPVVREAEMERTTVQLLNIPLAAGFRHHLRIYGATSPSRRAEVRVRVHPTFTTEVLAERELALIPGDHPSSPLLSREGEFPYVPAYAEIPALRELLANDAMSEPVRVEVTSLTEGLTFWAMLSITNNETQEVTLVTPQ